MRFVLRPAVFMVFSIVFIAVIFPLGRLILLVADPHRLRPGRRTHTYFNFRQDNPCLEGPQIRHVCGNLARKP
jgi:hypothetical protein